MRDRRLRLLFSSFLLVACSSSHETTNDAGPTLGDAAHGVDAAIRPGDAGTRPVDTGPPPHVSPDADVPMPPPGVVTCGGATCADGQACCLLTLACFDPSDASACAIPSGATDPGACASNADCDPDQICERNDIFSPDAIPAPACGGTVGHCVMQSAPSDCGTGSGWDGVCGCDGRTYPTPCAASIAGVRVSWPFACGTDATANGTYECDADHPFCSPDRHCDVGAGQCLPNIPTVACGLDSQCPSGYSCCGIVGLCMPTSEPERCFVPPSGSSVPCVTDADCQPLGVRDGITGGYYCGVGTGCGTPGGCAYFGETCGGALAPVCGCDGMSYSNECWARMAHQRIAHTGMCP